MNTQPAHITPLQEAAAACFRNLHQVIAAHQPVNDSLMTGRLGLCLYYRQLHLALNDDRFANMAVQLLEEVIEGNDDPARQLSGASFSNGSSGLGYMIELMKTGGYIDMDDADITELIDDAVFNTAVKIQLPRHNNDYLHGAMGILLYLSQRLHIPQSRQYAVQLVQIIYDAAVRTPEGAWLRNVVFGGDKPGDINFSLSHGNSGFLLLLLQLYEKGVVVNGMESLLRDMMRFMLHHRFGPAGREATAALFPSLAGERFTEAESVVHRLSWCYGDLNIVLALCQTARVLNIPEWTQLAHELGAATLHRNNPANAQIQDGHFCHGAAGVAQCYHKLFKLTGSEQYLEARDNWLRHTIQFTGAQLPAGYFAGKECGLLEGLPGMALVLLDFLHPAAAGWDGLFLL